MDYALDRLDRDGTLAGGPVTPLVQLLRSGSLVSCYEAALEAARNTTEEDDVYFEGGEDMASVTSKAFLDLCQVLEFMNEQRRALRCMEGVYDFNVKFGDFYSGGSEEGGRIREVLGHVFCTPQYTTTTTHAPPAKPGLIVPPVPMILLHTKFCFLYTDAKGLRERLLGQHWKIGLPSFGGNMGWKQFVSAREIRRMKAEVGRVRRGDSGGDTRGGDDRGEEDASCTLREDYQELEQKLSMRYKSHLAYYKQVYLLTIGRRRSKACSSPWAAPSPPDVFESSPKRRLIYVVGDSHALSLHGSTFTRGCGEALRFLAKPVTGLKASHVREEKSSSKSFFTVKNMEAVLEDVVRRSAPDSRQIIWSGGEIDCREGIGGELCRSHILGDESAWSGIEKQIGVRVAKFLRGLLRVREEFGIEKIYAMPVCQANRRGEKSGRTEGRSLKRRTVKCWNEALKRNATEMGTEADGLEVLDYYHEIVEEGDICRKDLELDGTHLGRGLGKIVLESLERTKGF